ncbi:hypothetical protein SAMN06893096_106233 [Geodermatophilus pulveris]|uniref:Uncharacterized protein n=1 Tax=Geodermatophilus pulveris TaxID=1564159 RepID=A0A239GJ62_9ACTN|nr:hypothetical protein [Geodermatophilus pulveris]SNS69207.1 hypothetical protein SAMN06893096_106233 [Geodermatophilus pulveris]
MKAGEAQRLAGLFQDLVDIHRQGFPPAQSPVAPPPPAPDTDAIRARHRKAALTGIGLLRRQERAAAQEQADRAAEVKLQASWAEAQRMQADYQAQLDVWWAALLANEPDTGIGTLAEAFEDNEAAAAPLSVDGDEVSLVVLAPSDSEAFVPERMPGTTASGNLSQQAPQERAGGPLHRSRDGARPGHH